jgi:two-component system response regulator MtrA
MMKILVTDANFELSERVRLIVKKLQPDWEIFSIDSGEKCLNMLHNAHKPDIVLVGMQLNDMSGFELIKYIRDDSDIPIVMLSKDNKIEALVKAFETGANDYVVEPYHDAVFIARLKALVRRREWDVRKTVNETADFELSMGD